MPNGASSAHLIRPKLITALQEGYSWEALRQDASAGLTVAVVALPLSMAIAVASGATPAQGLATAVVGGFIVSALGGSRFQIGGPAGAFIVLVAAALHRFGPTGLATCILASGALLTVIGLLRLGSLVRHIPDSVTVGFTAGIAAIIAASQVRDFAGLSLGGPEPGALAPKLQALASAQSFNPAALALGVATVGAIVLMRRFRPAWPNLLIALALAGLIVALFQLPVETIGSRFGQLPRGLPPPAWPAISLSGLIDMAPTIFSLTLLGAIESLLSAKVADGMTDRRHRSNMELVAQGVANMASAVFGGLSVTGTIARTATNIRAGARSPIAGILHAMFLLLFLLAAAPLCAYAPLSALAGILLVVAFGMADRREIVKAAGHWKTILPASVTLVLTLLTDLSAGIAGGCVTAAAIWAATRRLGRAPE